MNALCRFPFFGLVLCLFVFASIASGQGTPQTIDFETISESGTLEFQPPPSPANDVELQFQ